MGVVALLAVIEFACPRGCMDSKRRLTASTVSSGKKKQSIDINTLHTNTTMDHSRNRIGTTTATTTSVRRRTSPRRISAFQNACRTATDKLMREHGYSRERAVATLVTQLVQQQQQQHHDPPLRPNEDEVSESLFRFLGFWCFALFWVGHTKLRII